MLQQNSIFRNFLFMECRIPSASTQGISESYGISSSIGISEPIGTYFLGKIPEPIGTWVMVEFQNLLEFGKQ